MKPNPKTLGKLTRLSSVADLTYQRDMAALAAASAKVRAIEEQISTLRNQLNAPWDEEPFGDAMHVTAKHRVWIERCLRGLNLENSRAIVQLNLAKTALAQSSGRKQALKKLIEQLSRNPAE